MKGYVEDIEGITSANKDFRRVLYTGKHVQLVAMSIRKNDEIGEEVHEDRDQFFRVEKGKGEVVIDGETYYTADGAQYKPVVQENGEIWYEVIKANT